LQLLRVRSRNRRVLDDAELLELVLEQVTNFLRTFSTLDENGVIHGKGNEIVLVPEELIGNRFH
jgi:hypothetical protein